MLDILKAILISEKDFTESNYSLGLQKKQLDRF